MSKRRRFVFDAISQLVLNGVVDDCNRLLPTGKPGHITNLNVSYSKYVQLLGQYGRLYTDNTEKCVDIVVALADFTNEEVERAIWVDMADDTKQFEVLATDSCRTLQISVALKIEQSKARRLAA